MAEDELDDDDFIVGASEEEDSEDEDPGELVSVWHKMKKKYEDALKGIDHAGTQLNELSELLQTKYGINVPKVSKISGTVQKAAPAQAAEEPVEEGPGNLHWTPPVQGNGSGYEPEEVEIPASMRGIISINSTGPAVQMSPEDGVNERNFANSIAQVLGALDANLRN